MVKITKIIEVLREDENVMTVKHNDQEIIFDFGDEFLDEKGHLAKNNDEEEFIFSKEETYKDTKNDVATKFDGVSGYNVKDDATTEDNNSLGDDDTMDGDDSLGDDDSMDENNDDTKNDDAIKHDILSEKSKENAKDDVSNDEKDKDSNKHDDNFSEKNVESVKDEVTDDLLGNWKFPEVKLEEETKIKESDTFAFISNPDIKDEKVCDAFIFDAPSQDDKNPQTQNIKQEEKENPHRKKSKHLNEPNYVKCGDCSYKTVVKSNLESHVIIHHNGDPVLCEQCEFKTVSEQRLIEHVKVEHEGFRFECESCDYKGKSSKSFSKHKKIHTGKLLLCDRCDFKTIENSYFKRHILEKHEGQKYICDSCDYQATRPERLKNHIRVVHEGIVHQCNICQAKIRNRDKMARHLKTKHANAEKSDFTKVVVSDPAQYQSPCSECNKVHGPVEKHFSCDICNDKFSRKGGLRNHMALIHKLTKERPKYDESNPNHCHTCKKYLESETYKMYHLDTVHVEKVDYYDCRFCFYKTRVKYPHPLLEHLRSHTGERLETCIFCGNRFNAKSTLKNHLRLHTGEKPYRCKYCEKGFAQRTSLKSHVGVHHKDKLSSGTAHKIAKSIAHVKESPEEGENKNTSESKMATSPPTPGESLK